MQFEAILPAPFGALGVRIADGMLTGLEFLPPGHPLLDARNPLIDRIAAELEAYYVDPQHHFTLPMAPHGSDFRQRVWQALLAIPAGQTRSYGDIARELGSAPRAVGQAVGDNPIPILIPCHRVIAADGSLGGFMHSHIGYSQDIKRWLLLHENAHEHAG